MTSNDKRKVLTQYEVNWLMDGASESDVYDLMLNGWIGYAHMSDAQIDEVYARHAIEQELVEVEA
jgi:hypothetical protein